MNKTQKIITLITLLIGVITIIWLASFLFHVFMSFPEQGSKIKFLMDFKLNPDFRHYPQDIFYYQSMFKEDYPKAIKWAWLGSLLIHGTIALIIYQLFKKKQSLYGDARFANMTEIKKSGLLIPKPKDKNTLFAGKHVIVGKLGSQYIGLGDQQFIYLAAPTRSGKGVGVVIPVGLSYDHSMVVLDIKQELFEITASFRAKAGQQIYLFNPFDVEGRTACWNPLSYVSRNPANRVDDLNQIAICLIPDSPNGDSFFTESARKLFIGLGLYLLDRENLHEKDPQNQKIPKTIREILNLATNFSGEAISHFQSLIQYEGLSEICKQTINSAISAGDKTFASILATLTAELTPWLSEPVSNATSKDDFDLREVRKKRMTIYIGIQPKDLAKAKKIINLFYSQLINENTATLPQNDSNLKYQCLMLMDEGTSPGRIAVLEKAVSYMAGYNMRLLFIAQSPAQLQDRAVYGAEGARNILTNIALKVLYKPNDVADSEEYSKLLGKITVKEDTSKSRGGGSKGVSRTESLQQRDLMMPQELRAMSKDKEIILFEGIPYPIMAEKNKYYADPIFQVRYQNQPKPKLLSIRERMTEKEREQEDIQQSINKTIKNAPRDKDGNLTSIPTSELFNNFFTCLAEAC